MANSKNITFDQLQAALSRVKSALDGKANTSHGNHIPKTETANNARFLRNDNTWQTITPVNIGAADRSHSHGLYVNQNAFSNIKVGDTTVAADSPTDTLTLTAGANVTLTPDATNDTVTISAKDTVYTHPTTSGYKHIPSGGSSGQILRWSADGTAAWGSDNNTDTKVTNTLNTTAKAYVTGTTSATTNTGTQVFDTGVYLDTTAGKLVATTFAGALSGNASTATSLQTARKFTIGNTERTFNGSGDVKWTLADIGAAAASHNHTSLTGVTKLQFAAGSSDSAVMKVTTEEANTYLDFEMNDDINTDMYRWRFSAYESTGATPYFNLMTLTAKDASSARLTVNGDVTASSFTGNASSATKLQTARNIKIGNTSRSFNGTADVTWTLADIGAAAASHGTHVTWSTTTPKANGTAAVGTETKVARGDHVHPLQTTVSGNAGTATKLATARGFKIGNTSKNFDGSANVEWSLSEIGAAASSHTHNKITSRGKVASETGTTRPAVDGLSMTEVYNNEYPTAYGNTITLKGQGDGQILVGWSGSSGGHAPVYVRSKRDTTDANWSGWAQFYTSANPQPSVTGNAGTATKLATAKTITIGNTGKQFDGSGNISWSLSEIGAAASGHTHSYIPLSGSSSITGNLEFSNSGTSTRGIIGTMGDNDYWRIVGGATASNSGYLEIATADDANEPIYVRQYGSGKFGTLTRTATLLDASGNTSFPGTVTASSFSGNAASATKLQNARTLTIGNAGKEFDGSGNVSWSLDEMGVTSAITQSGNSILNTVSNTYTTKDEFNNLKIGGRNYVKNSNFDKGLSYWTTTHSVSDTILHNGHKSLRISVNEAEDYTWSGANQIVLLDVEPNTTVTISCWYYIQDKSTFDDNFGFELKGKIEGVLDQVFIGVGVAPNEMENGVWKRLVATATTDRHWDALYAFPWVAKNGTIYVTDFKIELGNKATDWTPAPEDMNDGITAINNKFADYSTTQQMNSAIQVAENDAKMDIRHNYVTKHEAAHYFEGENKWKLDLYSLGSMSASATPTKEGMIQNNCQYQSSMLVEHPSYLNDYTNNYVGYATTYMHFTEDYQWTGQVVTDDNGNVYLNDVLVLSTPTCQWADITLNFRAGWNKVEVLYAEGGGGDGWQFNPEIIVVPGGIMDKMNCYGQNSTEEYIKANYSTKSELQQTTNSITAKFSETVAPQHLAISDFSNYSQLRVGHNLSSKYGTAVYVNNDVDNHCYWCNGDNEYFPFTVNETVNPFKYGDKVGFKFDAYVQNALDVRIGIWFYLGDAADGYLAERTADIHLNPGWNSYSTQVTIDCTEVRRAKSVAIMIYKGTNNYIEVRNAVISRMISNVMIEDRAVTANKLGTIGGFQVEDGAFRGRYGTEGNNYAGLSGDGTGWAFWAGAYNGADAPFHVGHEGHLYATNATLAGTLDGNATTASRLQNARTFTIGNTGKNFDGSGNVSWSLGEIGAAASGHTHDSITGGNTYITTVGNDAYSLDMPNNIDISSWFGVSITNNCANTPNYRQTTVAINARTGEASFRGRITAHGAYMTNNIEFSEAGTSNSNAPGLVWNGSTDGADLYYRTLEADQGQLLINLRDDSNATLAIAWNGEVKATFDANGYYSGNANTATKLKTARSIGITGAVSGSANFDGSGNISIITTYCYPTPGNFWNDGAMVVNANTGVAEAGIAIDFHLTSNTNDDYHTRLLCAGNNKNIVNLPTGNGTLALTSDNVASATKLQTARNIKIGNTSRSFNGTGDVTWTLSDIGAAASNHNHDSAYLKLSGGTLSGQLTVNNTVYSQAFCVSDKGKELWLDIGDNDTYIWASGANKSLQITHSGDLNFDGQPVLYGGRGNNYDTATNSIYFNNSGTSHKGRISCYNDGGGDYIQLALRTADASDNYIAMYADTTKFKQNNIYLGGKKLTIATSAPSNPASGDVWINIG